MKPRNGRFTIGEVKIEEGYMLIDYSLSKD